MAKVIELEKEKNEAVVNENKTPEPIENESEDKPDEKKQKGKTFVFSVNLIKGGKTIKNVNVEVTAKDEVSAFDQLPGKVKAIHEDEWQYTGKFKVR